MKKGFTLIELLAVIVILAIIAVIAVPIVLNIIDDSKKNASLRSADFYLDAVDYAVASRVTENKAIASGTYNILENGNICIEYKDNLCIDEMQIDVNGEKPTSGTVTIESGKIKEVSVTFNQKTIVKNSSGELEYIESDSGTDNKNNTLAEAILNSYGGQSKIGEVASFATNPQDGEYGLYKAEDDYGMSYYFRGDVENNYVKFGEWQVDTPIMAYGGGYGPYTLETCQSSMENGAPWSSCEEFQIAQRGNSMYWRIIRINGDGTIRLIYDGTKAETNDSGTGNYIHYDVSGNSSYTINQFYNDNLKTKYSKYIADSIFCEEKVIISENEMAYSFSNWDRINSNQPKLTCTNAVDKLILKIGNITADEALMGGSKLGINSYLYGSAYYTITPGYQYKGASIAPLIIYPSSIGYVGDDGSNEYATRPVINLKADVKFKGTGKIDDPYEIIIE